MASSNAAVSQMIAPLMYTHGLMYLLSLLVALMYKAILPTGWCHGLDFALTPPLATPVMFNTWHLTAGQVQPSSITLIQSWQLRLPRSPHHHRCASGYYSSHCTHLYCSLCCCPVPFLHTPFTTHPSFCHMLRLLFSLVIIIGLPGLTRLLVHHSIGLSQAICSLLCITLHPVLYIVGSRGSECP
jgi:hypothetical protein